MHRQLRFLPSQRDVGFADKAWRTLCIDPGVLINGAQILSGSDAPTQQGNQAPPVAVLLDATCCVFWLSAE